MEIQSINQANFRGGIQVLAATNKKNKYLYNQVMDVVKANHVSATFSNRGIDFSSVTDKIITELKKLGIDFIKK